MLPELNAPKRDRRLMFSPEVGDTINWGMLDQPEDRELSKTKELLRRIEAFGQMRLRVRDYELTAPTVAGAVGFRWLAFDVETSWPASYRPR